MVRIMNVQKIVFTAIAVIGVALFAMPASAQITLINGSFEAPAFDPSANGGKGYIAQVPDGWVNIEGAIGDPLLHHSADSGFYANPVDGITILGLENQMHNSTVVAAYCIGQQLGTMTEGETYAFSATLFSHNDGQGCYYDIGFVNMSDQSVLAQITESDFDPSAIGPGETMPANFQYTATADDQGDPLWLIMRAPTDRFDDPVQMFGMDVSMGRTGIDDITITLAIVPDQIPGDANEDGQVDGSDVTILAGNWQAGVGGVGGATWAMGDFNGDGAVDGSDVTILAGNWQYGVEATAASVPEPGTLLLLLGMVASLLIRKRVR